MNQCHKFFQVVEETQPILYTPIFLGNECIVVASQNQRCLNQATVLSFCRFTANGDLIPLEYITNDPAIYDYAINAFKAQIMHGQNEALMSTTTSLPELRARLLWALGQNRSQLLDFLFQNQQSEPMETAPLYPLHATKATSTTELTSQNVETPLCRRCGCSRPQIIPKTFASRSRGCNTELVNIGVPTTDYNNRFESTEKLNIFEQRKMRKKFEDIV